MINAHSFSGVLSIYGMGCMASPPLDDLRTPSPPGLIFFTDKKEAAEDLHMLARAGVLKVTKWMDGATH